MPSCCRHTCRVGQNHINKVYIWSFWQGNHQIYGQIRCMYYIYGSDPPYTRAFNPAFSRCMSHNQHPTHLLTASHCARYLHSKAPLQRKGHSRLEGLPSFKNYIPTSVRSLPTGQKTRRPSLFYIFHSHVIHIITHWPQNPSFNVQDWLVTTLISCPFIT